MSDPMWLLVMFDLPVVTAPERNAANKYRHSLQHAGFHRAQLSVYVRYADDYAVLRRLLPRIKADIPPDGEVRVFRLTNDQWAAQWRFYGHSTEQTRAEQPENVPTQLVLFENPGGKPPNDPRVE